MKFAGGILHFIIPPAASDSEEALPQELYDQMQIRIHKVNLEDRFLESVIPLMKKEKSLSDLNRDYYFWSERCILFCTGIVGLLSAVSANGALPEWLIVTLGISAAVISFLSTFLIGLRGLRKWQETWLRHRDFLNLSNAEFRKYANYVEPYDAYMSDACKTDEENKILEGKHEMQTLQRFKKTLLDLIERNNALFMANMDQKH